MRSGCEDAAEVILVPLGVAYRVWPQVLNAMVLVKPATVVQWHRQGFRLYWRRRSPSSEVDREKPEHTMRSSPAEDSGAR
jgi:hypothetical protein